jgi:hypothetical protein
MAPFIHQQWWWQLYRHVSHYSSDQLKQQRPGLMMEGGRKP